MGCVYSRVCIGEATTPRSSRIAETQNAKTATEIDTISSSSSDSQEGETGDRLNQLNSNNRDSEAGITRLSRVSSQFLPAEGSRTVKVPSGNFELRYSFLSQRGYYPDALDKANQDSFCIHTPFGNSPDDHFFGVFDGHGEYGAQCSQFVKRKLCENLLRNSRFQSDAVEACHAAYLTTNSQLHADILDDSMSGTTAITVLVRGRTIYVANSGDSRAVIAERRGKEVVAVDLSIDQTPFRTDELERVKLCGARVLTLDQIEGLKNPDIQCWGTEEGDDGDPPRLWVPNGMYPGTAFTRSIGDSIAETIGVVATPEIVVLELTQDHPFFVVASDGVFEFLSSQTVVDMVRKYKDPRDACAAIVAESYRLWLQFETRTDDITILVVHINGLTNTVTSESTRSGGGGFVPSAIPQVMEVTGSESPSTFGWNRNNRARQDLSRARLRAIESSLENGQVWVPPSPAHRKSWEEEEESHGEVPRVLQHYTAEKLSSFGELALMYNKPLQASVRAVTSGTLWALKREDFRGILISEFSNLSSLKLLRSVDLLSKLTILQLSHIADCLSEVQFSDGELIVDGTEGSCALHIIQKGQVRITFDAELMSNSNVYSFNYVSQKEDGAAQSGSEISAIRKEGSYFGEWALLGERIGFLRAVAVGDVVCAILTKEKFESVVGPIPKLSQDDQKATEHSLNSLHQSAKIIDISALSKVGLSDLEWKMCLYSTEYSEIGLVRLRNTETMLSLKRFSRQKVKWLGLEAQVLKEKNLMKTISSSACVPELLCTCFDQSHAGILLKTCLACPLSSILHVPLDEFSARFFAASLIMAMEDLHKIGVLHRGISPDVLMLDQTGHIQLVDFRFGKKTLGERTFTICGTADFLAPEIVQGNGHGFAADWWALGVLIHFMLKCEMPFGSWRQSELDTFSKIAKGQLSLPQIFSPEAIDLITKLLEVDEKKRLGNENQNSVRSHPWFDGVDWKGIHEGTFPVPETITSRVAQYLESYSENCSVSLTKPPQDLEEQKVPEWINDW
ncbi:hypothetical protein Csa_022960 [Cucumis sativus]|nr:hypothetical protein Csa_022960 [Cucumis sativus]